MLDYLAQEWLPLGDMVVATLVLVSSRALISCLLPSCFAPKQNLGDQKNKNK